MVNRELYTNIQEDWDNKKAIVLTGARQVGKTTLITQLVENKNVLLLNGDDPQTRLNFANADFNYLKNVTADYDRHQLY